MLDVELPPDWKEATAEDGKKYYYNELTRETSWTPPGTDESESVSGDNPVYTTLYDDEATTFKSRDISDNMRARLIKEQQGIGTDPNQKSPFLAVFAGVGVFIVLGALSVNGGF